MLSPAITSTHFARMPWLLGECLSSYYGGRPVRLGEAFRR